MNTNILPNGNLEITMTDDERAYLAELNADGYHKAENHIAECFTFRIRN